MEETENKDEDKPEGETSSEDKEASDKDASAESKMVEDAKKAAAEIKEGLEERKKLVEREEKLMARQEAIKELGGGSPAGTESKPSITPEEKASREKIKKVGHATGAQWAKDMDKEDGD